MNKTYYISQGTTPEDHLQNIKNVCEAGCLLVQLRLKGVENDVFFETALKAKSICKTHQATLLINDNVLVAKQIDAKGVHLGNEDISPKEAREILGDKIIGGTANTLEDCLRLVSQNVDYIGLGPFRFTETKKKLSPILGLYGYSEIMESLKRQGIKTPVFAIGGILENDFDALLKTGIHGIAVSGLLTNASQSEIKRLIEKIESTNFIDV